MYSNYMVLFTLNRQSQMQSFTVNGPLGGKIFGCPFEGNDPIIDVNFDPRYHEQEMYYVSWRGWLQVQVPFTSFTPFISYENHTKYVHVSLGSQKSFNLCVCFWFFSFEVLGKVNNIFFCYVMWTMISFVAVLVCPFVP